MLKLSNEWTMTIGGISVESFLKQRSLIFFEEVSSGVYHTIKDRTGMYSKYVDSRMVSVALNDNARVVIKKLNGNFITNEDNLEGF